MQRHTAQQHILILVQVLVIVAGITHFNVGWVVWPWLLRKSGFSHSQSERQRQLMQTLLADAESTVPGKRSAELRRISRNMHAVIKPKTATRQGHSWQVMRVIRYLSTCLVLHSLAAGTCIAGRTFSAECA
ncbi:MAG: hypothetical protein KKC01_09020 [Gammaproteobacteria bacterium]|nr:hypothetical protein [Gammaproteobacteria bacterium]